MMRTLLPLPLLAALLAMAPLAMAQDADGKAPDCEADPAACQDDRTYKGDEPTYSGDCGGEVCAYGGEDCIECSGPVEDGSTCMDGQQEGETCRDDVQYMTPPEDEPTRGPPLCENCRGDVAETPAEADAVSTESDGARNAVPGLALVGTLAGLGVAALALRRR